jgi:hypothetical protein
MPGRLGKLFRCERFEPRVADVHLRVQRRARCVGIFMDVNDVALNVLNAVVVLAINNACADPREKLRHRTLMVRFGLTHFFLRDLHVEILRASETESGGQVNGLRRAIYFLGKRR